ncbi:hypothetical protein M8Z33_03355 [Streptomyces sp. ZAF1911]|nr:hypothetical protein [Streptomyces sp. ZAF1911]MDD9375726.1 hypothetical protein [Streptomyces sp. ZAF1911]
MPAKVLVKARPMVTAVAVELASSCRATSWVSFVAWIPDPTTTATSAACAACARTNA